MGTRALSDNITDWGSRSFASPGSDNDRSALLDEFIAADAENDTCRLIGELKDGFERSIYAYLLVLKLVARGKANEARSVLLSSSGMDKRFRFTAAFEIFMATSAPTDLFCLRAVADGMKPQDKTWAYLMIYRQTRSPNDIFLAGQALKAPGVDMGIRTVAATVQGVAAAEFRARQHA
jgi:hypothetical protein